MNRTRAAAALRRLRSGAAPEEAQAIDLAVATLEAEPTEWPRLSAPARVGHTAFGHNVSARLVVECAQRAYVARREEAAKTPAQHREEERKRREFWDLINGPLEPSRAPSDEAIRQAAIIRAGDSVGDFIAGAHWALGEKGGAEPKWPKARDVGRMDDMHVNGHLRVGLDNDNDVFVSVWDGDGGASVEFCNGGGGGGRSSRTRLALIELMVAMEADNAEQPALDWWALRRATPLTHAAKKEEKAAPEPEASLSDEPACTFCLERGCNGQCGGDDMMGASS